MSSVLRFDEWQDSNGVPVASGAGGVFTSPGTILQVVRATNATQRSTTSTTFTDVTGTSVTITPQKSDSVILVIAVGLSSLFIAGGGANFASLQITDSSNTTLSGAENYIVGSQTTTSFRAPLSLIGFVTPGTTSPVTYKLRFKSDTASVSHTIQNAEVTGQLYAIEVAA